VSVARFRVFGRFDGASSATVEVDRSAGLIMIRPLRRRRVYTLPLAAVAEIVVFRIIAAEVREKRKAKASKRKMR
jgi:hypothetical protein